MIDAIYKMVSGTILKAKAAVEQNHEVLLMDPFLRVHKTKAFLSLSYSSMYDQLSHPDRDSGSSCQGEDLYLQETDPLSQLDRGAHQR